MRWINQRASSLHSSLKQTRPATRRFIAGISFPALIMAALLSSVPVVASAQQNASHPDPQALKHSRFDPARINEPLVREFNNAWRGVGCGVLNTEVVVLIFKKADGVYMAASLGTSNENKQFSFAWNPATIALVHTHPNACNERPSWPDRYIADKYHVPVLTITSRGMFMYDPETKKISKLQDGLDWLKPDKWARNSLVAANP